MRKSIVFFTLLVFTAASAFAVAFTPTVLQLSAPKYIQYTFNGNALEIPVVVTGAPAGVYFLVFTKDKAASISKVTNGFLGWHYVNKIDTCLYMSPLNQLEKGNQKIIWSGKDDSGNAVQTGDYTYYIFGFDNVSPRIMMTSQMNTTDPAGSCRTFITHDTAGNPLAQPIMYMSDARRYPTDPGDHTNSKWVVGSDPIDNSLVETTLDKGWCDSGGLAFLPSNYSYYFHDTLKGTDTKIVRKWQWVPNGVSVLQDSWGDMGQFSYTGDWSEGTSGYTYGPGVISDGRDYLFLVSAGIVGTVSKFLTLDVSDGTLLRQLDLSDWWINIEDAKNGGQNSGGPTKLSFRNGKMVMGSHTSCMNMMIDPYYTEDSEAVQWVNRNGDITGDHNWEPTAKSPWICNDYNVGPYKYSMSADGNLFSAFPSFDVGAVSFGLYAPDGTGMEYQSLAGETANQKFFLEFVDYGSAYDGIYTTDNSKNTVDTSFWFVGHDSVKGMISYYDIVADTSPSALSVAQNIPNPFNPATMINFTLAKVGKVTIDIFNVAGQRVDTIANGPLCAGKHSVAWNASRFSAGVYFYTVKTGDFSITMKMTLLK